MPARGRSMPQSNPPPAPHPLHVRVKWSAKPACHVRRADEPVRLRVAARADEITVTSAPRPGAWSMEVVLGDELPNIVVAAQRGDVAAFTELVRRYQDLAFAAAYARLRDAHLAQDVAQEAFVQAHRDLPMLREPAAFPHWLRRLVAKYVDRVVRGRKLPTVPLDEALSAKDEHAEASSLGEAHQRSDLVNTEVARLPERERIAMALYYTADRPLADVAA